MRPGKDPALDPAPAAVSAVQRDRLEDILARLREQLDADEASLAAAFSAELYRGAGDEDLARRDLVDLYGASLGLWRFARERAAGEARVRVFNPTFEEHGWQSSHTVVEIVNDDMPFLVDSVSMTLNRHRLSIHLILHPVIAVERDATGSVRRIAPTPGADPSIPRESVMLIEVDRRTDVELLESLRCEIEQVLADVRAAVEDWRAMRQRLAGVREALTDSPPPLEAEDVREAARFLEWIDDEHFVFLGYREYDLESGDGGDSLVPVEGSGLGILRGSEGGPGGGSFSVLPSQLGKTMRKAELLVLTKANSRSTVHRPAYLDYISVKRLADDAQVVGERRVLGLFTSRAYTSDPATIPIVHRKVERVLERSGLQSPSHSWKALVHILETLPRDELFQASTDELFDTAMGILRLEERPRVRFFVREDPYRRFLACIVFAPRDRYNTEIREGMQEILLEAFGGTDIEFSLSLGESVLARVYFVVRVPGRELPPYDAEAIEERIAQAIRDWRDELATFLVDHFGEEKGSALARHYHDAFPPGYRDFFHPRIAVSDIEQIEELEALSDLGIFVYRRPEDSPTRLRLKLYQRQEPLLLSQMLPILENMGLRVRGEHPFKVTLPDDGSVFIHDFSTVHERSQELTLSEIEEPFREALTAVWEDTVENDGFNRLVVGAGLSSRQVTLLRACCKYLLQAGVAFSQAYMEQTLAANPDIAALLVRLFELRFDPEAGEDERAPAVRQLESRAGEALEEVPSLDQDRILRRFLGVVNAVLRTNYFQRTEDGSAKRYLSLKLDAASIPYLPQPRPRFEIFVYSPRFEAVHLRGGKVARGGLRWSDRREDFRTEILGLMKAQMVKNAVIVPVGAKGGFVVKRLPPAEDREAVQAEVVECYRAFVKGMLDLTDNIEGDHTVSPRRTVRYDEDDPYLVVAADKGTATFSDIANEVAASYGFWLGDAFASGGSAGYDHKRMGITARGAWESVRRHFRELGHDVDSENLTTIGIGDMSGDVFGNGMLLSRHILLVAAFNHRHVFVDPRPDPQVSFDERERLFHLSRSSWSDYDRDLISEGGGVFDRSAKSIAVTSQMKELLAIEEDELTPSELVHRILKAPADLLWNGGIGTFVKATSETHADVGDHANDAVRVDAPELGCKVVGEGGNLGLTQLARIEFASLGGRVNADFVDNSGGVDCSDHEVNIKIVLNALVACGELTLKHRNQELEEMTEDVAALVLRDNYQQALAISIAEAYAPDLVDEHGRMIRALERAGTLDRRLEFLPGDEELAERRAQDRGLTRPELALLLAYTKIDLNARLLASEMPDDPYFVDDLRHYFPPLLRRRHGDQLQAHQLRRQIVATAVTNSLVNRTGPSFAARIAEDTGAAIPDVVRAYVTGRDVFALQEFWRGVESLDGLIPAELQARLFVDSTRLLERSTKWLLTVCADGVEVADCVRKFQPGVEMVGGLLKELLAPADRARREETTRQLTEAGVPEPIAGRAAEFDMLFAALDIAEVARAVEGDIARAAALYFRLGDMLELHWLRSMIGRMQTETHWHRRAQRTAIEDVYRIQRDLAGTVLASSDGSGPEEAIDIWTRGRPSELERFRRVVTELRGAGSLDWAMIGVVLREARMLAQ